MQRGEQLMEPCEGQLHLRLDANRPHRIQTRRGQDQLINERALADTRLAPNNQRTALTGLHRPHESLQHRDLAGSANVVHRPPGPDHLWHARIAASHLVAPSEPPLKHMIAPLSTPRPRVIPAIRVWRQRGAAWSPAAPSAS